MLRWLIPCLVLAFAAGCSSYDFKVNDKLVYSPAPLFTGFDVPDEALRACLEQAIIDNKITAAAQLQDLNCSHAGISNLQGLATFTGLQRLKLSANSIRNLADITALSTLQSLQLDDNQVVDPVPLYDLPALQLLDLSGNEALQCPGSNSLLRVENLTLPTHCQP